MLVQLPVPNAGSGSGAQGEVQCAIVQSLQSLLLSVTGRSGNTCGTCAERRRCRNS